MKSLREKEESSGERPLKIFVDANTIVSGLIFEGNEALLLRLGGMGLCMLVTTRYIMEEVARVLRSSDFRLSEDQAISFLSYANRCLRIYENVKPEHLQKYFSGLRDKKDVHVLAAFYELKCAILVTGDKELLRKVAMSRTTRQTLEILLSKK